MAPDPLIPRLFESAAGEGIGAAERDEIETRVKQDVVALLYEQSLGATLANLAAASGLILTLLPESATNGHLAWYGLICAALLLRGLDLARYRRMGHTVDPAQNLRRFGAVLLINGFAWAVYLPMFFDDLSVSARAIATVFVCGVASGAVALTSSARWIATSYAAMLIGVAALTYLIHDGQRGLVLAAVGVAFIVALWQAVRVSNQAVISAFRVSRYNERLTHEAVLARERVVGLNQELHEAQFALTEANQSLEAHVEARTTELNARTTELAARKDELELAARRLSELANTDPLTGLANRNALATRLGEMLDRAAKRGGRVAVLFVDLDRFKEVNDALGHLVGDAVLRRVANRLAERCGAAGLIARWGGDEFVIAWDAFEHATEVMELAEDLRQRAARPIDTGQEVVRVDASVGVALYPAHGADAESLVRGADMAVYAAKLGGRAGTRMYENEMYSRSRERHAVGQALREAIENGRLTLSYQPILGLEEGRTVSFEALARWHDPDRGHISPAHFIPLAEESGSIIALGRWVLHTACLTAANWTGPYAPAIAVNVSAAQMAAIDLVAEVDAALKATGLPARRLQIELTESVFAHDPEKLIVAFQQLRERGVKVAIDDFGTGYSSLAYLRRLPLDIIKIDRTFTSDIATGAAPFVQAAQLIAESLGVTVTAEGVETELQHEHLERMGIHRGQGFFYSQSLTARDAGLWLERERSGRGDAGSLILH